MNIQSRTTLHTVADELMNGFWTRSKTCKIPSDYLRESPLEFLSARTPYTSTKTNMRTFQTLNRH